MNRFYPSFFALLFSSLLFLGCNYAYLPLTECRQDSDCPSRSRCDGELCTTNPLSGLNTACQRTVECEQSLACVQNICRPASEQEASPEKNPEGSIEGQEPDGGNTESTESTTPEVAQETAPEPHQEGHADAAEQMPEEPIHYEPEPEISTEPGTPPALCTPGSVRACKMKLYSDDPRPCHPGQEICLFDGSWDTCKPIQLSRRWFSPAEGESCDGYDTNCNGYRDEGCPDFGSTGCSVFHHIPYAEPLRHIAFAETSAYAYSPDRQIALHLGGTNNTQVVLSRLDFQKPTNNPEGPEKEWLLSFPLPNSHDPLAINRQGTLAAIFTNGFLYLWRINYDVNGKPFLEGSLKIASKQPERMGFAGDGRDLLLLSSEYVDRNNYHLLLRHQRVIPQPDGSLQSQERGQLKIDKMFNESWTSSLSFPTRKDGKMIAIASYTEIVLIEIPSLRLLKRIPLEPAGTPEQRTIAFHPTLPHLIIAPFNYQKIFTLDITPDAQGIPAGIAIERYAMPSNDRGQLSHWGFHPQTGDLYGAGAYGMFEWKSPTSGQLSQPRFLQGQGSAFSIHLGSEMAAIAHTSGDISLISIRDGKLLARREQAFSIYARRMLLSPNGRWLLLGAYDKILLFEITRDANNIPSISAPTLLYEAPNSPTQFTRTILTFRQDSKAFAWAAGREMEVYQENNGSFTKSASFSQHTDTIRALQIHPTRPWVLSGGLDNTLRISSFGAMPTSIQIASLNEGILGVSFYQEAADREFILATTRENKTLAWSVSFDAQQLPQLTALQGEANYPIVGNTLEVHYAKKNHFFAMEGDDFSYNAAHIKKYSFWISQPQADGTRRLQGNGVTRNLDHAEGVRALFFSDERAVRVYGFTERAIRVWYCPE